MIDLSQKLRSLLVLLVVVGVVGAASLALSGGAVAEVSSVTVDDGEVASGATLSGTVSLDTPESNVHLVVSKDDTYQSGSDATYTFSSSNTDWSGLDTSGLAEGTYTLYAWDDSSSSVSSIATGEAVTTTVTIDDTPPTASIESVDDASVTAGETIDVTYEAIDADTGIQSATLLFVDGEGNVVGTPTSVGGTGGSTATVSVTAPSTEDAYDLKLVVTDDADNTAKDSLGSVTVDNTPPNTGLTAPDDGAERTSHPEIEISVSENVGIQSVDVQITRTKSGNTQYFDGESWSGSPQWVDATKKTSSTYVYDTAGNISSDGTYTVISRVTDTADQTTKSTNSDTTSSAPLPVDAAEAEVTYTVDTATPTVTSVTVENDAGYDAVAQGDTVTVSATVTDATSGVDSVTVNGSAFGQSDAVALSEGNGDTYSTTFSVSDITVPDGSTSVTVTATDAFGQNTTDSDTIVLNTSVSGVGALNVHNDFVGIVADTNTSVRVTATGLTDDNGNTVTVGNATIAIADTTFSADITDGSVDRRIDPTTISNDAATDTPLVVEIEGSDPGAATDALTLVHEAQRLEEGYQLAGTPMPAENVLFTDVSDVTTYDPSGTATWVDANETRVGQGYYINADSDDARVGYVFTDAGSKQDYTQVLEDGYNLVSPAVDLNTGGGSPVTTKIKDDLGYESRPTGVKYHVQDGSGETAKSPDGASVVPFKETTGATVEEYEGYFVEVTDSASGDIFHSIASNGYNVTKGS